MISDKDKIQADFSSKKDTYYSDNYSGGSGTSRLLRNKLICEYILGIRDISNVLDAGCGPAILFKDALNRCNNYFALDMVKSNLDKIRTDNTSNRKIIYLNSDLDNFISNDKFNLIICSGSLEYTYKPSDNISKLLKHLEPGGTLIASLPNFLSYFRLWSEYVYKYFSILYNKLLNRKTLYYKRRLFNPDSLDFLLNSGFSADIKYRYFNVNILLQPFDKIFSFLNNSLCKFLEEKNFSFKKYFCSEFLVIIKLK